MAQKPLPDQPVILEALFDEAKRYINDFGPIIDKLLLLEQKKLDGDASLARSPWDLDYQKALIEDIRKRIAASSGGLIALNDYIERDPLADLVDFCLRMRGMDPNSNQNMAIICIAQQGLEKVRILYRNIIAKFENQNTASSTAPLIPDTPRSRHPIQGGYSPNNPSALQANKTETVAIERMPLAVTKAYQSYNQAKEADSSLLKDKDVYNYIKNNGCEIYEDELPDFETWARYLRQGRKLHGTQKNNPRAERAHGKNVIRQDEMG